MNKRVLVTGGGSGIGAGCALALAKLGCHVAISGRDEKKLAKVAKQHNDLPAIIYHAADVADRERAFKLVDWAIKNLGHIDILINSAGINVPKRTMAELAPEDWDQVLLVNATGTFNTMHATLPQMRDREDGLIINISSTAGKRASLLGGVAYSASKFAMTALGTAVSLEDGRNGIRVTNIHPGEVETPLLDQRSAPVSAERRAKMLQVEDIASLVVTIAGLPPRAHVADIVIKPTGQDFAWLMRFLIPMDPIQGSTPESAMDSRYSVAELSDAGTYLVVRDAGACLIHEFKMGVKP